MPKKQRKQGRDTRYFSGWLDAVVWREIKAAAEANDRSLVGEINYRLKLTLKLEPAE